MKVQSLAPGSVFVLSASARVFSPPDGVMLTIREYDGESWSSSSVPMQDVAWTDYSVSREIGEDTVEVQAGLSWTLPDANAWLEFRNMELVAFAPGEDAQGELSPTDTPTPPVTPTPADTPTPVATPTPLPTATPLALPLTTSPVGQAGQPQTGLPSTDLIIVTSTPTPADVFAAATQAALATDWARIFGPATATPANLATPTNTPTPIIVTNTPAPGNAATATWAAEFATAVAFTTGTPTPFPLGASVLIATNTPLPVPKQPAPTRTPTPIFAYVDDLFFPTSTPTPEFPQELVGKILFLSPYLARNVRQPNAFMVNPDGTGLALMTSRAFYDRAKARDAYSADRTVLCLCAARTARRHELDSSRSTGTTRNTTARAISSPISGWAQRGRPPSRQRTTRP